jgi:hypothetical protein
MTLATTEIYKNHTVTIYYDDDAQSPREWDNLGIMLCWHRRYCLGDGLPSRLQKRFSRLNNTSTITAFERWKNIHRNHLLILPLYLYDHSGLTMRTTPFSCLWDSGQVGWIYATYATLRDEYNTPNVTPDILERATLTLRREVEIYDHYLHGNVYGYVITDAHGNTVDSCWNHYGLEDCLQQARRSVDEHLQHSLSPLLPVPSLLALARPSHPPFS